MTLARIRLIPQTDLSVGVLAVLLRGAYQPGAAAPTLPGSRIHWFLQYKMNLTFKNPSVFFQEINGTFADFLDFSILFQHFPLRFPFGRSWAPWHQITSRLRPDCVQITSRLLPDYFQIASRLLQIASRLLPDCFQTFNLPKKMLPDFQFTKTVWGLALVL